MEEFFSGSGFTNILLIIVIYSLSAILTTLNNIGNTIESLREDD